MAKNLGRAIIDLLDSERVELRAAAATVLAAVGKGDKAVEAALAGRLDDSDPVVRRLALEALADIDADGLAPRLVPLLRGDDDALAERALELLTEHVAEAEATLRKEIGAGPVAARRAMAQLLLRRGTRPAIDAVLDQLADDELGEQALQLVRAELDHAPAGKLADQIEKSATARAGEASKALARAWTAARRGKPPDGKAGKGGKAAKGGKAGKAAGPPAGTGAGPGNGAGNGAADPLRDPDVARGVAVLGALLRLIGYLARPGTQALLLDYAGADQPRPIRLAAIAGLRRIVAHGEARGTEKASTEKASTEKASTEKASTEKVIEALIELADSDDPAVAQAAVDTLRGARIPEALAKRFAALAKSSNTAAQKLAMERLPAGGGASAIKALVEALGGEDPTARDAAGRGLAKAPEAVLPTTRALLAATDEQIARRYAGVLRSHRGHVSTQAIDELVERVRDDLDRHAKGKATADEIVLERVLGRADRRPRAGAPRRAPVRARAPAAQGRQVGRGVRQPQAAAPVARRHRRRDRRRAAVPARPARARGGRRRPDPHHAHRRSGVRAVRAARRQGLPGRQAAHPRARRLRRGDLRARLPPAASTGNGANEDLGAELLQGIIDERPRSKLAKAARNKLKLTGHLDEE